MVRFPRALVDRPLGHLPLYEHVQLRLLVDGLAYQIDFVIQRKL